MDDYGGIDPDLLHEANLLLDYELAKIRSPSSSEPYHHFEFYPQSFNSQLKPVPVRKISLWQVR